MRVRSIATGLLIGALLPGMALGYTGIFRSAFTSGSGGTPTGIAVGDFDNDGAVDAAVSNGDGKDISVQVGLFSCAGGDRAGQFCFQTNDCPGGTCKPDGTLSNVGSIGLDRILSALLQGRFDGDGLDDLIVAQTNARSVVFLKGLGNTDFFAEPGPPISVGISPVGLASADITRARSPPRALDARVVRAVFWGPQERPRPARYDDSPVYPDYPPPAPPTCGAVTWTRTSSRSFGRSTIPSRASSPPRRSGPCRLLSGCRRGLRVFRTCRSG